MAGADYRPCDVCGSKTFYDAALSYDIGTKGPDGAWHEPEHPYRVAGEERSGGVALGGLGDWAVLCRACAKTHRTMIVRKP